MTLFFILLYYWYADTLLHLRLLFHIVVSPLREYSVHNYFIFLYHCYIDSLVYMCWLFLFSCRMDHYSYYMVNCYMYIPVISLHDCFPLLILIYIVTGHECCWYVMCETKCHVDLKPRRPPLESYISSFPFPVILFHAINRAHVLLSCYMYHALFLFLIYCVD